MSLILHVRRFVSHKKPKVKVKSEQTFPELYLAEQCISAASETQCERD